ncbi:unnamed protein product, partial [Mycena citricolor]
NSIVARARYAARPRRPWVACGGCDPNPSEIRMRRQGGAVVARHTDSRSGTSTMTRTESLYPRYPMLSHHSSSQWVR